MELEELVTQAQGGAGQFAKNCRAVEEHTPATAESSLNGMMNYLMTELWVNGFSSNEIQAAFSAAGLDVVRYAGEEKRNGTSIRGTALTRDDEQAMSGGGSL